MVLCGVCELIHTHTITTNNNITISRMLGVDMLEIANQE